MIHPTMLRLIVLLAVCSFTPAFGTSGITPESETPHNNKAKTSGVYSKAKQEEHMELNEIGSA